MIERQIKQLLRRFMEEKQIYKKIILIVGGSNNYIIILRHYIIILLFYYLTYIYKLSTYQTRNHHQHPYLLVLFQKYYCLF